MRTLTKGAEGDKSIIFIHIPKTAGSTLDVIMMRQYERKLIFPLDLPVQKSIAEFKKLPEARKREIKVIHGHMRFGLHEYFPQPCTYITILRDPIERVISHYYYILRTPDHEFHNEVTSKNMSLKDYVGSRMTTELDNAQLRILYGVEATGNGFGQCSIGFGQCSTEMLESVKKNIREHFAVVGLTERFDETLILLKRAFGWKPPYYIKQNVTKNRPLKEEISKDTLNLIEKYNELDIELYRYVEEMFEKIINQSGHLYALELKQFKLLNEIYSKTYPLYRRVVKKVKS